MIRGRRAAVATALAIAATAALTAGCGGGKSSALALDPVAAAVTKTQDAGAARVRFALSLSSSRLQGRTLRVRGAGAIDGTSSEMSFKLGSMLGQMGVPPATMKQLMHSSLQEVALEQDGDYVIYLRLGFLSSQLPGGKHWIKVDVSTLGKSAGLDLGKLLSGSQLQPSDLLGLLRSEGAKVTRVGAATIDGAATTHYRVTIDVAKALQSKGLTSPLLGGIAAQMPKLPEDVWIGNDGLVRRLGVSYDLSQSGERAHVGMTMDLYDYGAQVTIAAPSSGDVFDATQFAQQGLGSALLH